ncbi:hypothetical protein Scep_028485 [Stephania cephalantha]|uniref:Histidyl-tRNA synthetase n=1 Tax=Stephania cephalantha TaxID=152367 RepID=A0AAP0EDW2_9MAGN
MVFASVFEGDYLGLLKGASRIVFKGLYFGFLNETSQMLVHVRTIIAWEGALALLLLDRIEGAADIMGKGTSIFLFEEHCQIDFDIAGNATMEVMGPDCEVLQVLTAVLAKLNVVDYEVEKGLTVEIADRICTFVRKKGPPRQILSWLRQERKKFRDSREVVLALKDLKILYAFISCNFMYLITFMDADASWGNEFIVNEVGSIAAGGHYDNLIKQFGPNQTPAVGLSLHVKQIFTFMEQKLAEFHSQVNKKIEAEDLKSVLGEDSSTNSELNEFLLAKRQ